jgi:hypothetical protein
MSGYLDLTINQGTTFKRLITIADVNNAPVNITNNTFRGQIRRRATSEEILAEFTCIVVNPAEGKLTINLTDTQTSAIPAGEWVYDVEWINGLDVARLLEGTALTTAEVTR